jgi:2,4-dienoyl-CoA reductase-like NADH-dependent reductase (Old Yellow Enzyme family)
MNALKTTFELGKIKLRNRLVLPPITTNYAAPDGTVTTDILSFYDKRSANVGLTIVEACAVNASGRIVPNSLGLWEDEQAAGIRKLARTIHGRGAAAVIQLNHAGPRCYPDSRLKQGFSPSGIAFRPDIDPEVMDKSDIVRLVDDFTTAAQRAEQAGFDGVEIHGAHLYLLSQFISPATNNRKDEYGNDISGRVKLAAQVVQSVKENVGADYPVFFRINAEERIEGGLALEDSIRAAQILSEAGVDLFDVSLIAYGGFKEVTGKIVLAGSSALPKEMPAGANTEITASFKEQVGAPVIGVGKFGRGPEARIAVEQQKMDLVAVGRQMICDPDSAAKMLDENEDKIIPCDECLACFASIGKGKPMVCTVNKNLPL